MALLCVVLLAGCGSTSTSTSTSSATPRPSPPPRPTPTPVPPLAAPLIVQVENSPPARPQSGLGSADIVYEYSAESGIGRFSLLFFRLPPPAQQVGPVRSARTVTVGLARQYHASVAASGASSYVTSLIRAAGFPYYDEDSASGDLFRAPSRYAPHNLYSDGARLSDLARRARQGPVAFHLWDRAAGLPPGGGPVPGFRVPITAEEQPVFTWHPELNGYTRTERTGMVTDAASGTPLVLPTVVVQQVEVTPDPSVVDVNGVTGLDHRITGAGPFQIYTGGTAFSGVWSQPPDGPPQLVLPRGLPAPVAPGEVWVCLVPTGSPAVPA